MLQIDLKKSCRLEPNSDKVDGFKYCQYEKVKEKFGTTTMECDNVSCYWWYIG